MIHNEITTRQEAISSQIDTLQKKIKALPEGNLLCVRNGHYIKWYKINGRHPVYIPKKDRPLAEALALKKFYQLQVNELISRLRLLETALEDYRKTDTDALSLLEESSCFRELLEPYFRSLPDELQQWADADYEQNPNHPEILSHKTIAGCKVRSKSEVIIANTLFSNKIPFRYECALKFQNMCFYPDFTIRHPQTGKIIYWEHFGMMDNPAYCSKTFSKLNTYANQGIIPTINLITTYETRHFPINSASIQQIVHEYFF